MNDSQPARRVPLPELAALFLRLGFTAFGGPAAHIAIMEDEIVARRAWLTREEFVDLLGATNLIPGPNSTELAIHIGHRCAGWIGLVVAGACFIVPAVLIVAALAAAYVRFGALRGAVAVFAWVKPVVVAILAQALWRLGRTVVKTRALALIGAAAVAASLLGVHELAVLALGGLVAAAVRARPQNDMSSLLPLGAFGAKGVATSFVGVGLSSLFFVFLKIGSVLFGSGYVLLAFLRNDLVERYHWLTSTQLLDAVAIGQVTPGPVFTTATFIGWILRGPTGALVATVGIFLPAFVFVALSGPLVPRIRSSPMASALLDGVNVASWALMLVVTWQLGRAAIINPWLLTVAVASLAMLLSTKLNSAWLIGAAAIVGFVVR